jgi:hypothetical protein
MNVLDVMLLLMSIAVFDEETIKVGAIDGEGRRPPVPPITGGGGGW